MKNDDSLLQPASTPEKPDSRRQFLQTAGVVAGALVLTRALPANAQETAPAEATAATPPTEDSTILRLDEHKELETVGGFEIIEVGADKVIVARTESGYVACSAICTHKGCTVAYKLAEKGFACPCHGARFDETGKVVKGPARTDLKAYDIGRALVVKNR